MNCEGLGDETHGGNTENKIKIYFSMERGKEKKKQMKKFENDVNISSHKMEVQRGTMISWPITTRIVFY